MQKTVRIITNVGWFRDKFGTSTLMVFLGITQDNQYGLFFVRPAFTLNGESFAKAWAVLSYEYLMSAEVVKNVPQSVLDIVVKGGIDLGTDPIVIQNNVNSFVNLKAGIVQNGDTLFAATTSPYTSGTEAQVSAHALYSFFGTGFTATDVEDLGFSSLPVPGLTQIGTLTKTINPLAFPELQADPVGAVKSAIQDPIGFAKANPISAGSIVVLGWEGLRLLGVVKQSPLTYVGLAKAKGRKR